MKRTLQELTIKDDFLFGAVMLEEATCRRLLELAAGISVGSVEVSREKSFVYHPEYRGVRLDVYAKDEKNTRYNVEMQVVKRAAAGRSGSKAWAKAVGIFFSAPVAGMRTTFRRHW